MNSVIQKARSSRFGWRAVSVPLSTWVALVFAACGGVSAAPAGAPLAPGSSAKSLESAAIPPAGAPGAPVASLPPGAAHKQPYCRWHGVQVSDVERANRALLLSQAEQRQSIARQLPWGVPTPNPPNPSAGQRQLRVLSNFVVLYDAELRTPIWTAYRLEPRDVLPAKRLEAFRMDPLVGVDAQASCKDYEEPIFDMGHLVPRADMNRSVEAMLNTFLLSNMAPQHCATNRGPWQVLEALVRDWAGASTLQIYTGVLHDWQAPAGQDPDASIPRMYSERLDSRRVAVPSHLFKIVVRVDPEETSDGAQPQPRAVLAWLIPNTPKLVPKAELEAYLIHSLVSVERLQSLTGIRYFPNLSRGDMATARSMLHTKASSLWPLQGKWPHGLAGRCKSDAPLY